MMQIINVKIFKCSYKCNGLYERLALTDEANVMQRNTMGAVAELCKLLSGTESWG